MFINSNQTETMAQHTEEYKSKTIKINEEGNKIELDIDGSSVNCWLDEDAKKYRSAETPYKDFDSLTDLAKEIIDNQ